MKTTTLTDANAARACRPLIARARPQWIALGVAAPILIAAARIKSPFYARALGFFVLVFLTTVASAAFIYADGGWRTLIVTNVLLSLGLALGFALPGAPRPAAPAAPGQLALYLIPVALLLVFGLPALVKARALYRMESEGLVADTMRIGAAPGTPAVLVQPNETPVDRRQMIVPSELLRRIGHSVTFDPEFTQALDYAATNAPGTLLATRSSPVGANSLLLGGPDLLKHLESDVRVRLTQVNVRFFLIYRWWSDSGQGGAP